MPLLPNYDGSITRPAPPLMSVLATSAFGMVATSTKDTFDFAELLAFFFLPTLFASTTFYPSFRCACAVCICVVSVYLLLLLLASPIL